jgi:hypothetical protein
MARPCIFCGSTGKLTAEHVFPDWSQPYLVSPYGPGTHQRQILRADGNNDDWSYEGDPATATVRTVCEPCNNGWMSDLEGRAKPNLLSMIKGYGRTYYPDGQKLLATWAVKTALVSGSKFTPQTPGHFYEDFYAAQEPADKSLVWLIATGRPYFTYVDYRPLKVSKLDESPVTTENAYAALLGISHVAFYVVGWSENEPNLGGLKPFDSSMLPLWPMTAREVTFPPKGPALGYEALDELADAPFGKADRSQAQASAG